jgi:hypothetical protein
LEAGLDKVWPGPPVDAEEAWARTVTEMLLGTVYGGAGSTYSAKKFGVTDATFYDAMTAKKPPDAKGAVADDPDRFPGPYPITVACQQSCTVALIGRGFDRSHFGAGMNAGKSEDLPIWKMTGAQWFKRDDVKDVRIVSKLSPPVGPGSLFQFYIDGAANTGPAHIGWIARVQRVADGKPQNVMQFFDTGAMNCSGRTNTPKAVLQGYENYDDPWVTTIFTGPVVAKGTTSYNNSGFGVLPPSPGLAAATDRMKRLWPLGFARLVIKRLSDQHVLYATPLLPMHHAGDTNNFSPARLMWALRGIPHPDVLTAEWRLYIPRGELAGEAFKGPRGKTLRDYAKFIKDKTGALVPLDQPITDTENVMIAHSAHRVSSDGTVTAELLYKKAPTDTLAWGVRSGEAMPSLGDVPIYLRGGEMENKTP